MGSRIEIEFVSESMKAPPARTTVVMGIDGDAALPWKKVEELARALRTPPLKLNVALGFGLPLVGGPDCELAVAVPTRVQVIVPPLRLITPTLPNVLPAALRDTSRVPQLRTPEPLTVSTPP